MSGKFLNVKSRELYDRVFQEDYSLKCVRRDFEEIVRVHFSKALKSLTKIVFKEVREKFNSQKIFQVKI